MCSLVRVSIYYFFNTFVDGRKEEGKKEEGGRRMLWIGTVYRTWSSNRFMHLTCRVKRDF